MRYQITNDELAALESRLGVATGHGHVECLVEVAWHLRQRDSRLALSRAAQARRMLDELVPAHPAAALLRARLTLTEAESHLLENHVDAAIGEAASAQSSFEALNDGAGRSDACQLQARFHQLRSAYRERDASQQRASTCASDAGDSERSELAQAQRASYESQQNVAATEAKWGAFLAERVSSPVVSLRGLVNDTLGNLAMYRADSLRAIESYMEAIRAYGSTGQLDRLITTTSNIGIAFACLNDNESALMWLQEQLDIARASGWPRKIVNSLLQAGNGLRHAGKLDAGYALLREAESLMNEGYTRHSRAMLLLYTAEAELQYGRHEAAIARLSEVEALASEPDSVDIRVHCLSVQAKAFSAAGDAGRALAAGRAALAVAEAQGNVTWAFNALTILANVHGTHDLGPPEGSGWPTGALHHLHAALDIADRIEGFKADSGLLSSLASEHARVREFEKAYSFSLRAGEAHRRENSEIAVNRAIAMEVRHKTASAEASARHHEQLANAQQRRAETLAQMNATLDRLGAIGRQITAQLDEQGVCQVLNEHATGLLGAASVSIDLLADDGLHLSRAFGTEAGQSLAPRSIALDDLHAHTAACARSRLELLVRSPSEDHGSGTVPTMSALFAPLLIGDRLLGVMAIQSAKADAYEERERLIFRTLCAYGAIALANSDAYRRLNATLVDLETAQGELVRKNELQARMNAEREETLAFLAHDLRSPLSAIVHMLADAAEQAALQRASRYAERALAMTDRFLEIARLGLMSPQARAPLDVAAIVDDACETLRDRARAQGMSINLKLEFGTTVLGHREALMRAVCNLIDNALRVSARGDRVRVDLRSHGGRIKLRVADRGPGMPAAARQMLVSNGGGAPGTGRLGLAIVAQVVQMHDAAVTLESSPAGTCVCLSFEPLRAAARAVKTVW